MNKTEQALLKKGIQIILAEALEKVIEKDYFLYGAGYKLISNVLEEVLYQARMKSKNDYKLLCGSEVIKNKSYTELFEILKDVEELAEYQPSINVL